jgi:hypothetical protein
MAKPSRQEQERAAVRAARNAEEAVANAEAVDESLREMTKLIESLGFSEEAASALVREQLIEDEDALLELDDEQVENL